MTWERQPPLLTWGRAVALLDAYFNCTYNTNEAVGLREVKLKEILEQMQDTEMKLPEIMKSYQL